MEPCGTNPTRNADRNGAAFCPIAGLLAGQGSSAPAEKRNAPPSNVAVFIDYENVYRALLERRENVLRLGFFERLRQWCTNNNRRVVRVVVYCNFDILDLHETHHQSALQNYGVETVHTSNQGKNYADLKLTIDVLTSMYSNDNIDEFFIMSNDKDMTPLLNTIRENKRNVTVITTGDAYNSAILQFADAHLTFEGICQEDVNDKNLVIEAIAQNYWERFLNHVAKQLENSLDDPTAYNHSGLDYVLRTQSKYHKIMKYELATIIRDLLDAGRIFFYSYIYREQEIAAFAPVECMETLLERGIIRPGDIFNSFDLDTKIMDLYDEAAGKGGAYDRR